VRQQLIDSSPVAVPAPMIMTRSAGTAEIRRERLVIVMEELSQVFLRYFLNGHSIYL
jgi:hypothetical protein